MWHQPDLSSTFHLEPAPNLRETLWMARLGPGDPCTKILHGAVWRASRTPLGPATEKLWVDREGCVHVDAWGPGAAWLVERAPFLCGALDDPSGFRPADPLVNRLARLHPGLRIGRTEAVFEAALGIIVEQRVATPDAWQSWRGMVFSLSERAPGPFEKLWLPPAADVIMRSPYEVFHRFGIERRRSDVLRRVAAVARRLDELVTVDFAEAYRRMALLPGVGPWTRARLGLVALGDADAAQVGDLHIPDMVVRWLSGERRGTDERMLELLEPFRGHRGRVTRLLMASAGMLATGATVRRGAGPLR
jgi:3-methyladenine DNA glycosylase/8-oxoguanine DNA glycosylase